jgi:hypothetical protein
MAPVLIEAAGAVRKLMADKANRVRELLAERDIEAVIPSIKRRKPIIPHDVVAYRGRNVIERMS